MEFLGKIIGAVLGIIVVAFFNLINLCFYAVIGIFAGFILQWLAGEWIINFFSSSGITIATVWPIGLIIGVITGLIRSCSTTAIKFKKTSR